MKKTFKIFLFLFISFATAVVVDITFILQFSLITYFTTSVLYFLSGFFLSRKYSTHFTYMFLFPLLALNILALVVNPLTFPILSPITFILAFIAFTLGIFTKRKDSRKKHPILYSSLLIITFLSLFWITFYFTPHYLFNKNRKEIAGSNSIYDKLDFYNLDGTPYNSNNFMNKTVLIDNWFLSCVQCIRKLPYLQSLANKAMSDSAIKIISVINGKIDSLDNVKKFLTTHPKINILVLYDRFNTIKNIISTDGYPIEIIIGKDGSIKESHDGFNKDESMIYVNETFKKLKAYNEK